MKLSVSILFVSCAIFATLVSSQPTRLLAGLLLRTRIAAIVDELRGVENPNFSIVRDRMEWAVYNVGYLINHRMDILEHNIQPFEVRSDGSTTCDQFKVDVDTIIPLIENYIFIEYDVVESCLRALQYICAKNFSDAKWEIDFSKRVYPSYEDVLDDIDSNTSAKPVLSDVFHLHFVNAGDDWHLY
jgi:hypothetical protein